MNYVKRFLPFIAILLIFSDCKKDKDNKIKISGFLATDPLGNTFGVLGNADDDWQLSAWSSLSSAEQGLLNFTDNINLDNTTVSTLYKPIAFPNPVSTLSKIQFRSDDSVKVKVVLVDDNLNVVHTFSAKIKGAGVFSFDVSDPSAFKAGTGLRYYYSFSATAQLNFKAGYGDILICRQPSTPSSICY